MWRARMQRDESEMNLRRSPGRIVATTSGVSLRVSRVIPSRSTHDKAAHTRPTARPVSQWSLLVSVARRDVSAGVRVSGELIGPTFFGRTLVALGSSGGTHQHQPPSPPDDDHGLHLAPKRRSGVAASVILAVVRRTRPQPPVRPLPPVLVVEEVARPPRTRHGRESHQGGQECVCSLFRASHVIDRGVADTHLTNFFFDGARADLTKGLSVNPAFQVTHSFALGSQTVAPSYNFGAIYLTDNVRRFRIVPHPMLIADAVCPQGVPPRRRGS